VPGNSKSLTVSDINGDGLADLVIGINDAAVEAFVRRNGNEGPPLGIRLRRGNGNPTTAGARVVARCDDGTTRTVEVYAGGGYLSQSSPTNFFALSGKASIKTIDVYWSDGTVSTFENNAWQGTVVLKQ